MRNKHWLRVYVARVLMVVATTLKTIANRIHCTTTNKRNTQMKMDSLARDLVKLQAKVDKLSDENARLTNELNGWKRVGEYIHKHGSLPKHIEPSPTTSHAIVTGILESNQSMKRELRASGRRVSA